MDNNFLLFAILNFQIVFFCKIFIYLLVEIVKEMDLTRWEQKDCMNTLVCFLIGMKGKAVIVELKNESFIQGLICMITGLCIL